MWLGKIQRPKPKGSGERNILSNSSVMEGFLLSDEKFVWENWRDRFVSKSTFDRCKTVEMRDSCVELVVMTGKIQRKSGAQFKYPQEYEAGVRSAEKRSKRQIWMQIECRWVHGKRVAAMKWTGRTVRGGMVRCEDEGERRWGRFTK